MPTHGTWVRLASWFPWMLMGQAEGHMFFRCQTHKFDKISDLPKDFLAKAEKGYSQYLDAPAIDSWGKQPNDSTFNMYKRNRKPAPAKAGARCFAGSNQGFCHHRRLQDVRPARR